MASCERQGDFTSKEGSSKVPCREEKHSQHPSPAIETGGDAKSAQESAAVAQCCEQDGACYCNGRCFATSHQLGTFKAMSSHPAVNMFRYRLLRFPKPLFEPYSSTAGNNTDMMFTQMIVYLNMPQHFVPTAAVHLELLPMPTTRNRVSPRTT